MPLTLVLSNNYGWPALAASSTFFLCIYQMINVSGARKKSGVKYPYLYAEKAEAEKNFEAMKFNCAQRAHANTLENLPHILLMTMIGGLYFPVSSAVACTLWTVGRVFYTINYSAGDPSKRNSGPAAVSTLGQLGLLVLGVTTSVSMIVNSFKD